VLFDRLHLALEPVDLAVLCAYVAGVIVLGVWVGRGRRSMASYLLGDRALPWWAILGSIVATETSTATFLSVPGLAYVAAGGDLRFLQLAIGYIVGRAIIVIFLLPQYFRGELFTAYEVLDRRFGGATKRLASVIFLVTRNLADGLRLFLTAIALEAVLGWSLAACIIVIGLATIAYTVFGGMKSVIWNDCVQMVVYVVGGAIAGVVILTRLPEGWSTFVAFGEAHDKFRVLDFTWSLSDAYTFWAGLFGGMFLTLGTHGTDQMLVQRYLCARSRRDAGRALFASGFVVFAQFALFLLLGVALACYDSTVATDRAFERTDRVFATFIVDELPANVGLIGVLLAAVFAAAMSTLSSSLNSSASALVNDLYLPLRRKRPSERHLVGASRICTAAFGVLQIAIGIAAQGLESSVVTNVLAVAGFSAGLLLGVFALGILTRRVDQRAALIGLAGGLVVLLGVKFGLPRAGIEIAWPWLPVIGSVATFTTGLLASYGAGDRREAAD
jgi:SSS family transporter